MGVALGLGLDDAGPGDRLAFGRSVGVGVACAWWVRTGVGPGEDDVPVPGDSPAACLLGGATST